MSYVVDPDTGEMVRATNRRPGAPPAPTNPVTQAEVETAMDEVRDLLESATEEFRDLAKLAAEREADWKMLWATALVLVNADPNGPSDAAGREATARLMTSRRQFIHETLGEDPGEGRHDPYRSWKIAAANASAQREHLKRLHAELDRLRSLNANLRPQV
jgi:hypothetical protein